MSLDRIKNAPLRRTAVVIGVVLCVPVILPFVLWEVARAAASEARDLIRYGWSVLAPSIREAWRGNP